MKSFLSSRRFFHASFKGCCEFFMKNIFVFCCNTHLKYHLVLRTFNVMSSTIPEQIAKHIRVDPSTGSYHPVAFASDFWLSEASLVRLNATAKAGLDLEVSFAPLSLILCLRRSQRV